MLYEFFWAILIITNPPVAHISVTPATETGHIRSVQTSNSGSFTICTITNAQRFSPPVEILSKILDSVVTKNFELNPA